LTENLPKPLGGWATSALVTYQHKEVSIRYIGLAILASVGIGVGTAEVMRLRQARVQRYQILLTQMLAEEGDRPRPTPVPLVAAPPASAPIPDAVPTLELDWAQLSDGSSVSAPPIAAGLLATDTEAHRIYQVCGGDQRRHLVLEVEDRYYRYYRKRPDADKTQVLLQRLHQQGQRAIATRDGQGYVVWVAQPPAAQQEISPWATPIAAS
jgi:hypothetical protein